ncbi:Mitogen-activated protein kinase kinase kinase 1 [Tolypocladium ophioglossoides CBS 100239]|uniref:Mitogen-activated protein kinase kinase kinase 1 n=1 Tax=Tolypocladium ophioglossoides (strain CBS 100239) TaxID=1163406 RepID=A0A0L0NA86_TOLOC|nr:Mitogen-activated protein kinase kinase kinase 1 [Tolypocladium ophioglossoides CBS 100239]
MDKSSARRVDRHIKGVHQSPASAAAAGSSEGYPVDLTGEEPVTPMATKHPVYVGVNAPVQRISLQRTPVQRGPAQNTLVQSTPASSSSSSARKRKGPDRAAPPPTEKRLCRFRSKPPQSFYSVYDRALSQRFYVLMRTRGGNAECPEETFEMTGSTGNVYTVCIGEKPSCNCPHAMKGNECKHVFYVLARVLQAPFELVYQKALLGSELRTIFAAAPGVNVSQDSGNGKRKPVEGECPICFCEFDTSSPESVVWCRAACGQNIHQECFETWARTKTGQVTCPLCRSKWQGDAKTVSKVQMNRAVSSEGYANVAHQLGISTHRDEGTYSEWYSYHNRRRGW